jgi:catechol 2,3-dioxygenase-like lactoylglutathione lyase family enzyme
MAPRLDHTIVWSLNKKKESAAFLAQVLDLDSLVDYGDFVRIELGGGVCIDYHDAEEISYQHWAILVEDDEFDALLGRMDKLGFEYYAQGHHRRPHEITNRDDGRALYFTDPDGNSIEIVTRHYVPAEASG